MENRRQDLISCDAFSSTFVTVKFFSLASETNKQRNVCHVTETGHDERH